MDLNGSREYNCLGRTLTTEMSFLTSILYLPQDRRSRLNTVYRLLRKPEKLIELFIYLKILIKLNSMSEITNVGLSRKSRLDIYYDITLIF